MPVTQVANMKVSIPSTCGRESVLCPRSLTTVSEELEVEELISFTINPEVKEKNTVTSSHSSSHSLTSTTTNGEQSRGLSSDSSCCWLTAGGTRPLAGSEGTLGRGGWAGRFRSEPFIMLDGGLRCQEASSLHLHASPLSTHH